MIFWWYFQGGTYLLCQTCPMAETNSFPASGYLPWLPKPNTKNWINPWVEENIGYILIILYIMILRNNIIRGWYCWGCSIIEVNLLLGETQLKCLTVKNGCLFNLVFFRTIKFYVLWLGNLWSWRIWSMWNLLWWTILMTRSRWSLKITDICAL